MITVRKSEDRGRANLGWLDSHHTFSFGSYRDPNHMGFGPLRVLNQDEVKPGAGFGLHPHQNMEILTYVLSGEISHRDSMGNETRVKAGEIQRLSAGTGITHSEYNLGTEPLEFLQIWFLPHTENLRPSYAQRTIDHHKLGWQLLASPEGADGSLSIHQNVNVWEGNFEPESKLNLDLKLGNRAWVQTVYGEVKLGEQTLKAGDGAAIDGVKALQVSSEKSSRVLVFEM